MVGRKRANPDVSTLATYLFTTLVSYDSDVNTSPSWVAPGENTKGTLVSHCMPHRVYARMSWPGNPCTDLKSGTVMDHVGGVASNYSLVTSSETCVPVEYGPAAAEHREKVTCAPYSC